MADDVSNIFKEGDHLGLILNTSKCEVITHRGFNVQSSTLCSFQRVEVEETVLLGAPLFVSPARDSAWSQRCDDLRRAVGRLSNISSQEALILLRASFSAPRVLHLLRCSPSKAHPALEMFDSQLRSAVCHITNSRLSGSQWLQASLHVKEGGLGVRRVASFALPAFLASAASTLSLQALILTDCTDSPECHFLQAYLSDWSTRFGTPPDQLPPKQTSWDRPVVASL